MLLLSGALAACFDRGDCLPTYDNVIKIKFQKQSNAADTTIALQRISLLGTNFNFYEGQSVNAVELPVFPDSTAVRYVFRYNDTAADSIIFLYNRETIIPSPDCGAFPSYSNVRVELSTFDSAAVRAVNRDLLINANVNFQIRF